MRAKNDFSSLRSLYIIILGLILSGAANKCPAQQVYFSHITPDNGLLSGNVRALAKDHQGFMWIGTEDGLQRYDGYSMVTYKYKEDDSTSIHSDVILNIYEDRHHNLWIGTMNGLCLYDRSRDQFRRFNYSETDSGTINGDILRSIFESSDGTLYFGFDANGFSYYTPASTNPKEVQFNRLAISTGSQETFPGWATAFAEAPDHTILIGGQRLLRFDPVSKKITQLVDENFYSTIHDIKIDSKGRIWLSTYGQGLYIYDQSFKLLVHHVSKNAPGYLNTNQVEEALEDREGNMWITSDAGLHLVPSGVDPLQEHPFKVFLHQESEPSSLLSNSLKAAVLDKEDRLWTGSYFGGVNIYDKSAFKFFSVTSRIFVEGSLPANNVFSFEYDQQDNLWIGTDGGGLAVIKNPAKNFYTNRYEQIELLSTSKRKVTQIKVLKLQDKNTLWIGTWGDGLFRLDLNTKKYIQLKNVPGNDKSLCGNEVMNLDIDSLNNLWIGTFSGLDRYDLNSKQFTHYPNLNVVENSLQVDRITAIHSHENHLWVAHEVFGMFNYNYSKDSFEQIAIPEIKEGISISSIYHDSDGMVWLGSSAHGLVRYDPRTKQSAFFGEESGLANNIVNAILGEAHSSRLWVSTNSGLSEFNTETKTFTNYNKADGLQGSQFNPNSAYHLQDSLLLFGGTQGFDAFNPKHVAKSKVSFPIVFTRFWLNNKEVKAGETPLPENIIITDSLILNHNQNSLSIEFAMLEFNLSRRNQYRFQMENLNDQWQDIFQEHKATFTNLDPGTYVLNVQASNSDGIWSKATGSMVIIIRPAWWQTTLFKIALIIMLIAIAYISYRLRVRYLLSIKENLELQVKERTTEVEQVNAVLARQVEKISKQNSLLEESHTQIAEKNSEILAQNEELISQHDQIIQQREQLEHSQIRLQEVNENLESLVSQRTHRLEETIRQLDKSVAELDRFVYSASHDLSAPLKSVLGLVNIARKEKDYSVLQHYYDYIEKSIAKLDKVIKSLVEFARNSHQDVVVQQFELHELVQEIFQEFAYWPEVNTIGLMNQVNAPFIILSDKARIKVALHNIIGNSIKYADVYKPHSFINVSSTIEDSSYLIVIEDNGIGIKKEHQSKIFEMYYRASDLSKGSGLGLFIVQEIAIKINATLEMRSEYGAGTTFTLRIKKNG